MWKPVGGDVVRIVGTKTTCRVKTSDSRSKKVVLFVPTGTDDDGDVVFDCRTMSWSEVEATNPTR